MVNGDEVGLVTVMLRPSQHPYHLAAVATAHCVVACATAVVIIRSLSGTLGTTDVAPAWACLVILSTMIAAEPARRRHPGTSFGPANTVTLARSVLVAVTAGLIGTVPTPTTTLIATVIAFVALLMDGLDGWVARRTNTSSEYGAQLDMELDAVLTLVLCALLIDWNITGSWVLFCGLARYVWIAIQAVTPWFCRPLPPAFRRKTACVLGVLGLTGALAPWPSPTVNLGLALTATCALAVSFGIDAGWLIQRRKEPLT